MLLRRLRLSETVQSMVLCVCVCAAISQSDLYTTEIACRLLITLSETLFLRVARAVC